MTEPERPPLTDEERTAMLKHAADVARQAREADDRPTVDPTPFAVIVRRIQEIAAEATGYTVEELLAEGAKLTTPPDPNGPIELRRMTQAGVPPLHRQHLLDPKDCDALRQVRTMLAGDRPILVLSGGLGTCKTGSACWMLGQHWGGVFVKAKQLLGIAFDQPARYAEIVRARYVVLDDAGAEVQDEKGHWLSTFTDAFDDWYGSGARLVVTTNLARDEFAARYGERVIDRIRERGRFYTVAGKSVRR